MIVARLGMLFLRGAGRRGLVRMGLMVAGTSVGVWGLILALSFPGILHARQDRAAARRPNPTIPGEVVRAWYGERTQPVGAGIMSELFLAAKSGQETALPPGVASLPPLGKACVSPALARAREDPGMRAAFPYPVACVVGPRGLVSPDELFAVVRARRQDLPSGGYALEGYGMHGGHSEVDIAEGDLKLIQISFAGLAGIPLAVFFSVIARLSAATRNRRLAALRLLGMSQRDARRVNTIETVASSLAGGAVGLAIFGATNAILASSGMGRIVWFPADSRPSPATIVLCLIGVPALAAVLGIVGSGPAVRDALAVRRQAPARRPGRLRLVPLGLGLAVLLGLLLAGSGTPRGTELKDPAPIMLLAGVVSTGVGLALGLPLLATAVARMIAGRTKRLWLLLGMRRLAFEPSSATRVVAGLVVVVFATGFATGIQRDARAFTLPLDRYERYQVQAKEVPPASRRALLAIPEVRGALVSIPSFVHVLPVGGPAGPGQTTQDGGAAGTAGGTTQGAAEPSTTVGYGRCADLAVLLEHALKGCRDHRGYRIVEERYPDWADVPGRRFPLPLDATENPPIRWITVPSEALSLRDDSGVGIGVLFPLDRLPGGVIPDSATVLLASDASTAAIGRTIAAIGALAPLAQIGMPNDDVVTRRRSEVFQSLLNAALALGVLVGIAAFVVGALDRAVERRSNLATLQVVGVPAGTLRPAQAAQVALPLLSGALLAVASGKIAEQATVAVGGTGRSWLWGGTVLMMVFGLAAAALAVGATVLAVSGRIDISLLRRE
ncbi:MAG: ABC transporter permease [Acidobacteria bacterium]|nr:ABC transporter permease [Acidobacteriota bacterium]